MPAPQEGRREPQKMRGVGFEHERQVQSPAMDVGASSPHPQSSKGRGGKPAGPEDLVFLTINVSSWMPFRDRWAEEGEPQEMQSATVLFLQEHQLTTKAACGGAEEWCEKKGGTRFSSQRRPSLQGGRREGSPYY